MKKENSSWFIYLVKCLDNSLYTGITNDIEKRMKAHKENNGSKYVRSRGFGKLIGFKKIKNKSEALKLELKIKKLRPVEKLRFFVA
jgi:putative endonuclease